MWRYQLTFEKNRKTRGGKVLIRSSLRMSKFLTREKGNTETISILFNILCYTYIQRNFIKNRFSTSLKLFNDLYIYYTYTGCFFFFFFFFFFWNRMHQNYAAPMNLERSLHYWREGGVDQVRGWRRRCLKTRVLKVWRL